MELILLSDHQGQKLVSLNGYLYTQHSTTGQAIVWRCKERVTRNCTARLRTSVQLTNAVNVNTHNHLPNSVDTSAIIQLTEEYSNLKQEVATQRDALDSSQDDQYDTNQNARDQTSTDYMYVSDNIDSEAQYLTDFEEQQQDEEELDPDDPNFDPDFESPVKPRVKKVPSKKKKEGTKTSKPKSDGPELSLLSGLFHGAVIKKRKKKPNTLKGPTKKDMPPEPRYPCDIVIDGIWAVTESENAQRFLLYDNHDQIAERRVILFITDDHLSILCNTNRVHLDSVICVPPMNFAQILLIQASLLESNYIVTVGYALMGSLAETLYVEVFQALKSKARDLGLSLTAFSSGTVYMSYDKPSINAMKRVFGVNTRIEGKFFHFNRAIWKKIQSLDLVYSCQSSEDFKLFCTQLACLAFLPVEEVRQGMLHLKQVAPSNDLKVDLLLDWFDSTFISGAVKAARINNNQAFKFQGNMISTGIAAATETIELHQMPAPFAPEKWNISDTLISANSRTENVLEGSFWTVKNVVGHNRPSFFRCLKYIRMEEAFASSKVLDYEQGNLMPRISKRSLVEIQDKLSRLCISYRENDLDLSNFLLNSAKLIRLGEM